MPRRSAAVTQADIARVLRAAEQECRNLNHYYVGALHVLLALLEQRDPDVDARLAERGIRADSVQAELRRQVGAADERLWEGILITPRVRHIVALAEAAAGEGFVEPVHLFDALCTEGRSVAATAMLRASRNPAARTG